MAREWNLKYTFVLAAIAAFLAVLLWGSGAQAVLFTQMIGDNDGYGLGCPNNGLCVCVMDPA
jgi:hypothetical protein